MTHRRFRNLPLFWKILLPFTTLMLLVAVFGTFLIVRTLAIRAQSALDHDLARRSLEIRAALRDRELSLLESATLASNLEGMAEAVATGDRTTVLRLAESVAALKSELATVAIVERSGRGMVEIERSHDGVREAEPRAWNGVDVVGRALAETTAAKHADLVTIGDRHLLAIAAPVCTTTAGCSAVGVALVGVPLADALAAAATGHGDELTSVSIHDPSGALLAAAGSTTPPRSKVAAPAGAPTRRSYTLDGEAVATLSSTYEIRGRSVGTLAVTTPTGPAFEATRAAAVRLGALLLAAMAGVVAIGAIVSRVILVQVRPLVDTNRRLGRGDLAARAPVLAADELGELARGVNQMAEQLQASYATLEARVQQRTEEVQRLLQERTEFFAAISHELRTPLAVIIAQAELMRDPSHPRSPEWTARTGATIGDSASQLLALVNDILELARAEAGRLVVSVETVDVSDEIRALQRTIDGLAAAAELTTTIDVPQQLFAEADPARLRSVLLNLIDNAVKYTPPRGRVTISARSRADGMVEITVADTGIGLPADLGERIFEPFFRVPGNRAQRAQASSGLGLAVARRLVEAQGGEISYTDNADVGSTFTFTLPASRVARRPSRPRRRRPAPAGRS